MKLRKLRNFARQFRWYMNTGLTKFISVASSKEKFKAHLHISLYKNAYYLMASSTVAAIFGFVFWILVARFYSVTEVGLASALVSATGLLGLLSMLGLNIGIIRFLPNDDDKTGMMNSCFTLVGIFSIALSAIFIVGIPLWAPALLFLQENKAIMFAFILFTLAISLGALQNQVFIALRAAQFSFIQRIIALGLRFPVVLALVSLGAFGIFSSWGIAGWVALAVGSFLLVKVHPGYRPIPTVKRQVVSEMTHFSLGNYVAETTSMLPDYLLPLIIVNILGAELNAYFYIAYAVASPLFMIPRSITTSLFAEGSNEPDKLRGNTIRAAKLIFPLLIPAIIVIFLFGDKILLLFGTGYSENAFNVLRLLSLSVIAFALNDLYVVVKRVELRVKPVIYIYSSVAILILAISYMLMSRLSLTGVAIGFLLGQGIVALVLSLMMLKQIGRRPMSVNIRG